MRGRVRGEAAECLVKLAAAAHAVPAPRLVPRDCDVHEALEEVAFRFVRRTPRKLELFVGGEELATTDELNPLLKVRL